MFEVSTEKAAHEDAAVVLVNGHRLFQVSGLAQRIYPDLLPMLLQAVQTWANAKDRWDN